MNKRRVVVTGLGMVTPLGHDMESTWKAIIAGKSGVAAIDHFDASDLSCQICSRVKNFDASPYMSEKEARKRDYFIQYGMAAAMQAIQDSGLEVSEANAHRIGLAVGSGIGGLPLIEKSHAVMLESGPRRISPFFIPGALINMIAGNLSIQYGMRGPNIALVSACTTGTHNIGVAARTIVYGDADVMIAGASEMATTKLGLAGFASMRALSTRNDAPEKASRPWDKDRDGFVLGDGAGVIVLEEYEHAKARGAKIYAELIGFGMSADAHHMTSPDPEGKGAASAMKASLIDAGIKPEEVQYINAHATSTPAGDELEVKGIKRTFGDHAYQLAVSSTKSMTGHLLGAAGAVEAIFSILAIRDQVAPPTINLENPSESCDLNFVPNQAQPMKIDVSLSNSFGFGGTNGTLVFRKMK
ncbi:beta-ketoacyl-ACP synthase II [Aquicella lusitana]|uniref:3-oxoacyl-[acyl-carrier-protein] synthase 2 n=1 Tax=Aquicella lusitana TaxID=254246 RepID=A0A370GTZ2_9COXI|nr:beta-ketoacyl-ACP synthase II [Aquicella lusitana]RDI46014.1 3-oxoacyl-[acyl-carrier-protein] synthase II [Aquicella lusitana]VVC73389.1 3-oxoacyl-[acyl-carrier-protein] synthase 2 [Aquicella lusitana]